MIGTEKESYKDTHTHIHKVDTNHKDGGCVVPTTISKEMRRVSALRSGTLNMKNDTLSFTDEDKMEIFLRADCTNIVAVVGRGKVDRQTDRQTQRGGVCARTHTK